MRLRFVFIFIFFLIVRPVALQAQKKITLDEKDITPKRAIELIGRESGYQFFYNKKVLEKAHNLSLLLKDATLEEALKVLIKNQPFTYLIGDGCFYIEPKTATPPKENPLSLITVRGVIQNEYGQAFSGLNVTVLGTRNTTTTNANGHFYLTDVRADDFLEIAGILIDTAWVPVHGQPFIPYIVKYKTGELSAVNVVANTGYQRIQVPKATGSFWVLGETINGYSNIVQTMEGNVPGWLGVTKKIGGINQPTYFTLGARVTIHGDPNPLLVVDNFIYQGQITDINPQDIESIVFLKDAASAAIWGSRAGNGVVVVTTKSGQFNRSLHLSFDAFASGGSEPDAFYGNVISASDRVDADTFLFGLQHYRPIERLNSPSLSPVVEHLLKHRKGLISDQELETTLNAWRLQDVGRDKQKYYYRKPSARNLSLSLSGGGKKIAYFLSGSYRDGFPELYRSYEQRKTATLSANWLPFEILGLRTNFSYTHHDQRNTEPVEDFVAPYGQLADQNGNPLDFPYLRRQPFIDTIVAKYNLLPWNYSALTEFRLRDQTRRDEDLRMQLSGRVKIFDKLFPGLEASFYTQYQSVSHSFRDLKNKHSFYVRDLVNAYTQPGQSGSQRQPIQWGHILEAVTNKNIINDYRFQLGYHKNWPNQNNLTLLAGTDKMRVKGEVAPTLVYNYDVSRPSGQLNVDYNTLFTQLYNSSATERIPPAGRGRTFLNSFRSYYAIANAALKDQYFLSASARIDRSNLFGLNFHNNAIPLFSTGFAWNINSASFYKWRKMLEILKFHATIGTTGNVPVNVAMFPSYTAAGYNANGDPMSIANNPPLASMKWEKVRTMNLGADFQFRHNFLSGSFNWYRKNAWDLLAYQPFDATTGNSSVTGNVASMLTDNIDLTLVSQNINRKFQWQTSLLFTFLKEKVTASHDPLKEAWEYCDQRYLSIVPGKPLYGIYSFSGGEIDKATGDPIGYDEEGHPSKAYSKIVKTRGYNTLRYHGRSSPKIFGSIGNEFIWRGFNLSFLVTYKLGYFYRRPSIDYDAVYQGASPPGSGDIAGRWRPGQESNVPSMIYPNDKDRDILYNFSENLVQRGDHLRLYNVQFSYDVKKEILAGLGLGACTLYVTASNLGILCRAGDNNIDPDQVTGYPAGKQFSLGIKGHFR